MRTLGLDIGDKRIGMAISDPSNILASPLTIIERADDEVALSEIVRLVKENDVARIIVGLPRSMNGAIGSQAVKVKEFARQISERLTVPLEFRDERLSTVSARRLIQESRSKKARQQTRDDAIAAAYILQGFLDENTPE